MFHVTEAPKAGAAVDVAIVAIDSRIQAWLKLQQLSPVPLEMAPTNSCQIILVGNSLEVPLTPDLRRELLQRAVQGSTVVFVDPGVFRKGNDPVGWLPLKNKGRLTSFERLALSQGMRSQNARPVCGAGAAGNHGLDYYGPLISNRFFEGQDTPDDVAAAAFAICHSSRPDGYAAGLMLGSYVFGAGKIVPETLSTCSIRWTNTLRRTACYSTWWPMPPIQSSRSQRLCPRILQTLSKSWVTESSDWLFRLAGENRKPKCDK